MAPLRICIGRPSSRKSRSPISNVGMTRSPCFGGPSGQQVPGGSTRGGGRPSAPGAPRGSVVDREALVVAVGGRRVLPRQQPVLQARVGHVRLAYGVVEDAVGVDLERQVLPAVDDVRRGLGEDLVDPVSYTH